jgi:hypothetical protein
MKGGIKLTWNCPNAILCFQNTIQALQTDRTAYELCRCLSVWNGRVLTVIPQSEDYELLVNWRKCSSLSAVSQH